MSKTVKPETKTASCIAISLFEERYLSGSPMRAKRYYKKVTRRARRRYLKKLTGLNTGE